MFLPLENVEGIDLEVLFHMCMPENENIAASKMYIRTQGKCVWKGSHRRAELLLYQGAILDFSTYYNSFSYSQYLKYTVLTSVWIRLKCIGRFELAIWKQERGNVKQCLGRSEFENTIVWNWDFSQESAERGGFLYCELRCLSANGIFRGGSYEADLPTKREVHLAVDMCTYHREDYVYRNLQKLQEDCLQSGSEIKNNLEVFVIDNGKTIQWEETENIHILANRNCGGSGGFSRGLVEISRKNIFTHVLMMDDDTWIETEMFYRLIKILSICSGKFREVCVAGGLLSTEEPLRQVEAGAKWHDAIEPMHNLDFQYANALTENGKFSEKINYSGWWCFAFPVSCLQQYGLPLPLFVRADDIEFGLRIKNPYIVLNGVGVWHEPFLKKYSARLEYYTVRNHSIVMALQGRPLQSVQSFLHQSYAHLLKQDYLEAEYGVEAIRDFLSGVAFLENQNEQELLQKQLKKEWKWIETQQLSLKFNFMLVNPTQTNASGEQKNHENRFVKLGKWFLPAKGYRIVNRLDNNVKSVGNIRTVVHWDPVLKKAYITQKQFFRFLKDLLQIGAMWFLLRRNYFSVRKQYSEMAVEKLGNPDFWQRHLGIYQEKCEVDSYGGH